MRFHVYTESGGKARWNLRADDDRILASSVGSFGTNRGAERSADDFRDEANTCDYDVWDNDGAWYWDGSAAGGKRIVSGAGAGFVSESRATLAYENVRDHAAEATGP